MHTVNQDESNGSNMPGMIIQKIKDVIRGKDIFQKSKSCLNRTELKTQHKYRKLIVLT